MKTKILIVISITAVFLGVLMSPATALAQRLKLDLNYSIGIPSGSFKKDAVDKASFLGWTANIMYDINDRISVGAGTGYQDFYQKYPRAVYKLTEGGEISAVLTNSIQTIPILAQVQYKLISNGMIQPYVGVGVGGNVVIFDQYLGEFGNAQSDIRFAARPEAGLFVPFRKEGPAGIHIFGAYNYMPYKTNGVDDLSNWGAGIGVKFPLR